MKPKRIGIIIAGLLLSASCFAAVDINPNAGTTSATFLKYGIGSRAVAMGNAFSAIDDDVTALYWNPAGLAQLESKELGITHNESFENLRHDFVGYAVPFKKGVLAAAVYGLYTPNDLERRSGLLEDDPYEPITSVEGYFGAHDMAAHVSYGRWFSRRLALGASVKYIQQTIDTYNATGAAVDMGSLYKFDRIPLSLALSIQNVGTPIKFIDKAYDLPLNVRLGSAYKFSKKLNVALDFNQPNDNYLFISAGTEYSPIELISIRAGYRYRMNGPELGDLYGFSGGVGFNFKFQNTLVRIDYAFVPYSVLGNSQRLSIGLVFGKKRAPKQAEVKAEAPAPQAPAVTAQAQPVVMPQLPKDTAPIVPNIVDKGYTMYPVNLRVKRRMAGAGQSIFIITGKTTGSDLVYFEGVVKAAMTGITVEAGEKNGEGKVYKHFVIKRNFNVPVYKAVFKVRVPKNFGEPAVKTEEGVEINTQKASEDADYVYYRFFGDEFKSFRIERQ